MREIAGRFQRCAGGVGGLPSLVVLGAPLYGCQVRLKWRAPLYDGWRCGWANRGLFATHQMAPAARNEVMDCSRY